MDVVWVCCFEKGEDLYPKCGLGGILVPEYWRSNKFRKAFHFILCESTKVPTFCSFRLAYNWTWWIIGLRKMSVFRNLLWKRIPYSRHCEETLSPRMLVLEIPAEIHWMWLGQYTLLTHTRVDLYTNKKETWKKRRKEENHVFKQENHGVHGIFFLLFTLSKVNLTLRSLDGWFWREIIRGLNKKPLQK